MNEPNKQYSVRELLEAAAQAAGYEFGWIHDTPRIKCDMGWTPWNPLDDDGDVFRLAVRLRIAVDFDGIERDVAQAMQTDGNHWEAVPYGTDPLAATRLAVVRAAAEIVWKKNESAN